MEAPDEAEGRALRAALCAATTRGERVDFGAAGARAAYLRDRLRTRAGYVTVRKKQKPATLLL